MCQRSGANNVNNAYRSEGGIEIMTTALEETAHSRVQWSGRNLVTEDSNTVQYYWQQTSPHHGRGQQ